MNAIHPKLKLVPLAALLLSATVVTAMARDAVTAESGAAAAGSTAAQADVSRMSSAQASSLLVARYESFVGSSADTRALIQGLRHGERVTLTDSAAAGGTVSFLPSTRAMGWGNVDHALSLARADLAAQGIAQPTASQLKAALNGGTVTNAAGDEVNLQGVLALRSEGKGWGEIGHALKLSSAAVSGAGKAGIGGSGAAAGAALAGRSTGEIITDHGVVASGDVRGGASQRADVALPSASVHGSATAATAVSTGSVLGGQHGMSGFDIGGNARGGLAGGVGLGIGRR